MNNWLFALCMLIVAVMLNIIATFFRGIFRMLKKKRKREPELVTVMSAEYIDRDFLGRREGEIAEKKD